jgi:hypothetical protein
MVLVAILVFVALLFLISSFVGGLLVGITTIPLLYVTGYGFLPFHRLPANGGSFRTGVAIHVAVGTGVFGLLTAALLLTAFLPEGLKGTASILLLLTVPAIALAGALVVSDIRIRSLSLRSMLPLVAVWYGYPHLVLLPFLWLGISQGWVTYSG